MSKSNISNLEINSLPYESLPDLMEEAFAKYKTLIAYENMGSKLTFQRVNELSRDFAAYLMNKTNLKRGDRIAIQMPNLLQYPIVMLGALRAGLIVVNVNPLYTSSEILYQIKDAGVKAIVVLENFAKNLEEALKNMDSQKEVIITRVGDMLGPLKGFFVNSILKYLKGMIPKYNLPYAVRFNKVLREGKKLPFIKPNINREETAFLQYTGGTTGVAKGAMLSHRNIIANIEQVYMWGKGKVEEKKETTIAPLPMYHIFCLTNILLMLKLGAKSVLITNPRSIKKFIKELKKHPFTILSGVNTLFNALLSKKAFCKVDFSHCKIVLGAGASIQEAVAKKWEYVTGTPLIEGYGLTEASPGVVFNPSDGKHQLNSIGLPLPHTQIKITDDEGQELPNGEVGELLVRGPQIMKGYWNRQDETDQVFLDGWLKTGDIAVIAEDGYVKIIDRKKEMINVSGLKVYPTELEGVAVRHPKILEAGVIGIPDERSGEAVKLFVVRKDRSISKEEIISHFRKFLTGYKIPKYIEFRKSLPKSPIGKILRRVLKEEEGNTFSSYSTT